MNELTLLAIGFVIGAIVAVVAIAFLQGSTSDDDDGLDTDRIDALQRNHWQVGCIDGVFAVLGASPPKVIGRQGKDVRDVIDHAMVDEVNRANV